ncbi:hypothetical protein D3C87_1549020 [compost metagenome]
MLVRSVGMFWREDCVYWGAGSKAGSLLGVPYRATTSTPIDFRKQIGIYALYADYQLVYVGQAGSGTQSMFTRLKQHRKDDLAGRWNRFSWFGVLRVLNSGLLASKTSALHPGLSDVLNHIEAILIHSAEPPLNGQGGRFGENVTRYKQVRDSRLGPTSHEIMQALYAELGMGV